MSRRRSRQLAVANIKFGPDDYRYHSHLCGCGDDLESCVTTCFCPQYQLGINEWRFHRRTPPVNTCVAVCCMDIFSLGLATCICTWLNRSKYRKHYGDTQRDTIDDCARGFCCNMCTICQDAREMKMRANMAETHTKAVPIPVVQPQPVAMYAPTAMQLHPHSDPPSSHSLHASQLGLVLPGQMAAAAPAPLVIQAPQPQPMVLRAPTPAPQPFVLQAPPMQVAVPPPMGRISFSAPPPQPTLALAAPPPVAMAPAPAPGLVGARDVARFGASSAGVLTTSTTTNSYHPRGGAGLVHPSKGGSGAMLTTTYAVYPQYHVLGPQGQTVQSVQGAQPVMTQPVVAGVQPVHMSGVQPIHMSGVQPIHMSGVQTVQMPTQQVMLPTVTPARTTIHGPISPVPFPTLSKV